MLEQKELVSDKKNNNQHVVILHINSNQFDIDIYKYPLDTGLQLIKRKNTTEIIVYMPEALEVLYHQRKKNKIIAGVSVAVGISLISGYSIVIPLTFSTLTKMFAIYVPQLVSLTGILNRLYHLKNQPIAKLIHDYKLHPIEVEAESRNLSIVLNTTTVNQAISLIETSLISDATKILYPLKIYFEILEEIFPNVIGAIIMQYHPPHHFPKVNDAPNISIEKVLPNMQDTPKTISFIANDMGLSKDIFTLFKKPLPPRVNANREEKRKCCVIL